MKKVLVFWGASSVLAMAFLTGCTKTVMAKMDAPAYNLMEMICY